MSIIESFTPGRIRLRSNLFKDDETRTVIAQLLQSLTALRNLQINERTGSCLLEYDPQTLSTLTLLQSRPLFEKLQSLEKEPESPQRSESLRQLCLKLTEILQ